MGATLGRVDELGVFEACAAEPGTDKLGGATYLPSEGGIGDNARNTKKPEEVFHVP